MLMMKDEVEDVDGGSYRSITMLFIIDDYNTVYCMSIV